MIHAYIKLRYTVIINYRYVMRICSLFLMLYGFILYEPVYAEWEIASHTITENNSSLSIAKIINESGYSLEIYRDENNVVRSRFRLDNRLDKLADKSCPTYRIDEKELTNRSINDAKCISGPSWAEFVLGYIVNNEIKSTSLNNIMNGNTILYRFILAHGGYGETKFSLSGSKRIIMAVLGENISVKTEKVNSN